MNDWLSQISQVLGETLIGAELLGGGRNSQVYAVQGDSGTRFAVKRYDPATGAARLRTEFGAFTYLHAHRLTHTPRALASHPAIPAGVYSFVEGEPAHRNPCDADVQRCASFLLLLHSLGNQRPAWDAPAAEACFSFAEVLENLLVRERALAETGAQPVLAFLAESFAPLRVDITAWATEQLARAGLSLARPVPFSQHILSPSDFGLHNALRQPDGRLVFVDFEYFGWDDPAKTLADFLLHPGQRLSDAQRCAFVRAALPMLDSGKVLATRLPVAYALFGLKWCLILLNEFLRVHAARRDFAGDERPEQARLHEQMEKAQQMAARIAAQYREFPYLG